MNVYDIFRDGSPFELDNAIKLIGKDWTLITVRDGNGANAMTASWGCLGYLWGKPVAVVFIRPQRYTYSLVQNEDTLSLAFFGEGYREALALCGSKSGRDCDKLTLAGLTHSDYDGVPIINEASLVLIGKKLYTDTLRSDGFIDKSLLDNYKSNDYHQLFVLEIQKTLIRK